MIDLTLALSGVMDMINPGMADHQKRVALIAASMGAGAGLSAHRQNDLIVAGALHDIGASSLKERRDLMNYEEQVDSRHAEVGYRLLNSFQTLSKIAEQVRFHHVDWNHGEGQVHAGQEVPLEGHILNLSDRVEILLDRSGNVLTQKERIRKMIREDSGKRFHPSLVDIFLDISSSESFWLDLASRDIDTILLQNSYPVVTVMELDTLESFARFLSRLIDLRSRFTAAHSTAVGMVGATLAGKVGFSADEIQMMRIAGYLHDIGKLAVPLEILEKPARLTEDEENFVRYHSYLTYRTLQTIPGLETINQWASLHHERLNGSGYPFRHLENRIPLGSRILAVADVFTALAEDRPYRPGLSKRDILRILRKMSSMMEVDPAIVELAANHFEEIETVRSMAFDEALRQYDIFRVGSEPLREIVSQ